MNNQNSELKTNEEYSEESDFYSEEEEKQYFHYEHNKRAKNSTDC